MVLKTGGTRRLFVAVELDDPLRSSIAWTAAALPEAGGSLRRTTAEEVHLTLRFIGDVPAERVDAASEALHRTAHRARPFDITLGRLGVFPESGPARVLWIGVQEGGVPLAALAGSVEEELVGCGFAPENRVFVPHITVARIAALKGVDPYRPLSHNTLDVTGRTQSIRRLVLYESRPVTTGARYSVMDRAALGRPTG